MALKRMLFFEHRLCARIRETCSGQKSCLTVKKKGTFANMPADVQRDAHGSSDSPRTYNQEPIMISLFPGT
jgi:hypothetical protein